MALSNLLILAASACNFIFSFFAFSRPHKTTTTTLYAALTATAGAWGVLLYLFRTAYREHAILVYGILTYVAAAVLALVMVYFVYYFTDSKQTHTYRMYVAISIPFIVISLLVLIPHALITGSSTLHGVHALQFTNWYVVYSIYLVVYFNLAFYTIARRHRDAEGVFRLQLKHIFLGLFPIATVGLVTNLILPWLGDFRFNWIGPVATLVTFSIVGYSVFRYRLMGMRFLVMRFLEYLAIAAFVYAVFLAIVYWQQSVFGSVFALGALLAGIPLAFIFVWVYFRVQAVIVNVSSSIFYATSYNPQVVLKNLINRITAVIDLEELTDLLFAEISRVMRAEKIALIFISQENFYDNTTKKEDVREHLEVARVQGFSKNDLHINPRHCFMTDYLKDNLEIIVTDELGLPRAGVHKLEAELSFKQQAEKSGVALTLPLITHNKLSGVMVLGEKKFNDAYTKEDIDFLDLVARQSGIAVENARLYANLEKEVEHKTKVIEEKSNHLEELLKVKSEFLTIASHQLRTPTSIVKGMLSMIVDGSLDKYPEKRQEFLEKAYEAINRLGDVIHDLLNATELEGGEIRVEQQPTQVEEIVADAVEARQQLLRDRNLTLAFTKPKKPYPPVLVDPFKIREVIANILDNAIYYTLEGGVTVTIMEDKPTHQLRIAVRDTGIGIIPEDQQHLFEKFVRGSRSSSIHPNGSGLGLFIVKKILETNKGGLEVHSAGTNKGSTFTIILPIAARA